MFKMKSAKKVKLLLCREQSNRRKLLIAAVFSLIGFLVFKTFGTEKKRGNQSKSMIFSFSNGEIEVNDWTVDINISQKYSATELQTKRTAILSFYAISVFG